MKRLVLAEKPSVAKDLAGVLGRFEKRDGYWENDEYVVTWAIGHLVTLADPEDYHRELKKWSLETLPILPESFRLKPNFKTIKQFKIIKELVNRLDIVELINATDAGREGENIFRFIYRLTNCEKPFKRLWLSETTPEAVRRGFASLRPGSDLNRLAYAAEARSRADWLIGINATRAFTVRHNELLSVGRVQTPTLALIVNREKEIKNFVSTPYWELYVDFTKDEGQVYRGKWFRADHNRFDTPEAARAAENKVTGRPGIVRQVEEKDVFEKPPLLFNLNDLQKEANKKFGMSAAKTLEVAQALYETKKLLTYPRTDSRHLTKALAGTIPNRLNALSGVAEYAPFIHAALAAGTPGKRYVDDSKVSDHTALIPTDVRPELNKLSPAERKIYDLVVRRFLSAFFPPAQYKQTRVVTEASGETFLTTGRVELEQGWKKVYAPLEKDEKEEEDTAVIPALVQGERVQIVKTEIQEKKTQPPKRFTEAGLLAVMESAGRLMEDQELRDAMKGHGLGTPATRAAIIERLIKVGYIERKKKNLVPTAKGEALINLVPNVVKSPEMTGYWEKTLADIENGTVDPKEFMSGITELTKKIVGLVKNQEASIKTQAVQESLGKCPRCGKDVIEGKKGYGCSGYKEGCTFVVWKEIAGKKITLNQAQALLKKGKTALLKGFKSKKGNKFDAALKLDEGGIVAFEFSEKNSRSLGSCPLCGKEVIEFSKSYSCSGYKEGCKFVIWKEMSGNKISVKDAQELLKNGKTAVITGFKSKAGKEFAAALVLRNGKVSFQFVKSNGNITGTL